MSALDSNDLECPHCGATFYYELTRCPNCGQSVYPEGEEDETDAKPSRDVTPSPITGILVGVILSSILGIFLFFILNSLLKNSIAESPESLIRFLPLLSIPIGVFVGSYVSVALNQSRPLLSGLAVGLISIGASIILIAYQYNLAIEPLIHPETIPWWITTILLALAGSYLRHRTIEKDTLQQLFIPRTEYQLYTDLLTKVQFDRPTADSLIAYEQKRAPNGTRFMWIQNAIDRWERDNRTTK